MEKIYRVQMNSSGMPNFATAEEIPKGEWIAIGTVCEVICKHCIKANGHCQHHWKCPLLTEIAKLMESKDEPQTNADQHVQRVEYVECVEEDEQSGKE